MELLANALRANKNINGITVKDKIILLKQHTDNTTIFVADTKSAEIVFEIMRYSKVCAVAHEIDASVKDSG